MPEFTYRCNMCDNSITKMVFKDEDRVGYMSCHCGGVMERVLKAPTTRVVEVLDNGVQPRRIERLKDIDDILKERSEKFNKDTGFKDDDED